MKGNKANRFYRVKAEIKKAIPELKLDEHGQPKRLGVYVGKDFTSLTCDLFEESEEILLALASPIEGSCYGADKFYLEAQESFVGSGFENDPDRRWRKAALTVTPSGKRMKTKRFSDSDGNTILSNLAHMTKVICNCYIKNGNPVTEWQIVRIGLEEDSQKAASIEVYEKLITFPLPLMLRSRFTLGSFSLPELPSKEQLVTAILADVKKVQDEKLRERLTNLVDIMAVSYILAFGGKAVIPEAEFKKPEAKVPAMAPEAEAPAPAPETETTEPVAETKSPEVENPALTANEETEEEPETTAMVAVGGGTPIGEPTLEPDVAGAQAAAVRGDKATRGRRNRHASSKGKTKRGE